MTPKIKKFVFIKKKKNYLMVVSGINNRRRLAMYDDKIMKQLKESYNEMESPASKDLGDMSPEEKQNVLAQYIETKQKLEKRLHRINSVIEKLNSSL